LSCAAAGCPKAPIAATITPNASAFNPSFCIASPARTIGRLAAEMRRDAVDDRQRNDCYLEQCHEGHPVGERKSDAMQKLGLKALALGVIVAAIGALGSRRRRRTR